MCPDQPSTSGRSANVGTCRGRINVKSRRSSVAIWATFSRSAIATTDTSAGSSRASRYRRTSSAIRRTSAGSRSTSSNSSIARSRNCACTRGPMCLLMVQPASIKMLEGRRSGPSNCSRSRTHEAWCLSSRSTTAIKGPVSRSVAVTSTDRTAPPADLRPAPIDPLHRRRRSPRSTTSDDEPAQTALPQPPQPSPGLSSPNAGGDAPGPVTAGPPGDEAPHTHARRSWQ